MDVDVSMFVSVMTFADCVNVDAVSVLMFWMRCHSVPVTLGPMS